MLTDTKEKGFKSFLQHLKPSDNVLELGGHFGRFTQDVEEIGANITSYEPSPENADKFEENTKYAKLIRKGVWAAENGIMQFKGIDENDNYRFNIFEKRGRKKVIFKAEMINFLEAINNDNFNALKMDIEGAEIEILKKYNMEIFNKFDLITFEFHTFNRFELNDFFEINGKYAAMYRNSHLTKKPTFCENDGHFYLHQGTTFATYWK